MNVLVLVRSRKFKQRWARIVLRRVTAWEPRVMLPFFAFPIFFTFLNNLWSYPGKEKYIFSITRLSPYVVSFFHTRTKKLAHVLKLKEITSLGMQKFYDARLISKVIILHFRLTFVRGITSFWLTPRFSVYPACTIVCMYLHSTTKIEY